MKAAVASCIFLGRAQTPIKGKVLLSGSKHSTTSNGPSVMRITSPTTISSAARASRPPSAPADGLKVAGFAQLMHDLHDVWPGKIVNARDIVDPHKVGRLERSKLQRPHCIV